MSVEVGAKQSRPIEIVLNLADFQSEVTVTTERGTAADVERTPPVVTVREADDLRGRPIATLGNALEGGAGVMVQQSTYGQVSPFLRGLTGYHVLNLIDGIRLNNSTFRSGPNQYLAFVAPDQVQRIEAMLGPASSQFGSDALGGAIQVVTTAPRFASSVERFKVNGDVSLLGASADESAGAEASAFVAGQGLTLSAGGSWRRLNDVRAGKGQDSHHVLRRLFGLSDEQIQDVTGSHQRDTGFTQSGFQSKLTARLAHQQNLTFRYQRSDQDDVRGYKDLWGGLGRLRSDFQPQRLQFFYTRYEKLRVGGLDWLSGTFSINSQRDGSIRQGLRATDRIIQDDVRVDAFGYVANAGVHLMGRQSLVFGGEVYDEHIDARRDETDPGTGAVDQKRALYPDGSRYRTTGLFFQDVVDLRRGSDRGALKANIGGRFTRVDVDTFADRNLNGAGQRLGVVDSSQSYQDWTFNAGLTWQATTGLALNALVGRGFRAPNLNDLGALGLNDLGYEVPGEATLARGKLHRRERRRRRAVERPPGQQARGRASVQLRDSGGAALAAALRARERLRRRAEGSDRSPHAAVSRSSSAGGSCRRAGHADCSDRCAASTGRRRRRHCARSTRSEGVRQRRLGALLRLDTLISYHFSTRWFAEGNYSYLVGHDLDPRVRCVGCLLSREW